MDHNFLNYVNINKHLIYFAQNIFPEVKIIMIYTLMLVLLIFKNIPIFC